MRNQLGWSDMLTRPFWSGLSYAWVGHSMRVLPFIAAAGLVWAGTSEQQIAALFKPTGIAGVLFFVSADCPISNSLAPEIQQICRDYENKGIHCSLVYEDLKVTAEDVRKHQAEYRYDRVPALIDADGKIAKQAKATVTPEAIVIDHKGIIRYRGRVKRL